jgi:hypothetical protein
MPTQQEIINRLKRDDIIRILGEYYKSIGREQTPDYTEYSLSELRKCIYLFNITIG